MVEFMFQKMNKYYSDKFPYILALGYVFLLSGMFLVPERGGYKTLVYIFLVLPLAIFIMTNAKVVWRVYFSQRVVFSFFLIILYIALTSLWGEASLLTSIRRVILYALCAFGLFFLYSYHQKLFFLGSIVALLLMSSMTLFWLIDFYVLNIDSNYFAKQLFNGVEDYFNIYGGEGYASFFNPLMFSHVMVFSIALTLVVWFDGSLYTNVTVRILLVWMLAIFFAALLAGQTRMAWIVAATLIVYELVRLLRLHGLLISVIGVIAAILLIFIYGDELIARGDSHRISIWQHVIQLIIVHPLLGAGLGAELRFTPENSGHTWYDTHSFPLAVLYYTGVVGAGLLFTWLCYAVNRVVYWQGCNHFFIVWLIVFLLGGLTDGGGLMSRPSEHWFNIWIPLFLMLGFLANIKKIKLGSNHVKQSSNGFAIELN